MPLEEGIENLKYTSGVKFFDLAQNDENSIRYINKIEML